MATSETNSQPSTHDSTFRPRNWKKITDHVFEVYNPAPERFNIEIVFVHGARTTSSDAAYYRTWMKGDDSGSWLDTWLVECFPRARIISVSYDSNLTMSDTSGQQDMYLIVESLGQCLVELAGVGQSCPVVLVGHCVGGLVLKNICIWAQKFATREIDCGMPRQSYVNFLKYVKGAFLYSTPNLGSDLPLRAESDQDAPLRRYLEVFHPEPGRSNDDFTKLRRQYGWRTFGVAATNKTRKRKREDIQSSNNDMDHIPTSFFFVEEGSARVDMDEFCSIAGVDHWTICTPSSQESLSFALLRNFVEHIASLQEEFEVELQSSLGLHSIITNLDDRLDHVIEKIQLEKAEQIHLALVGMDGIGKSTLAKQILLSIGQQFDYTCFVEFEEVRPSERSRELEKLVAQNMRYHNGERVQLSDGEKPWKRLRKKKVLMIVDDVDSEHQISSLLISGWCGEWSRLIITSSNQNWPRDFIVHSIQFLSSKASRRLFEAHVDELVLRSIPETMVSQVVNECEGLPLILDVIGKYLRDVMQEDVWRGALERLHTTGSLDGHCDNNAWRKLKVSFEGFEELEKNIFLDITTFEDLRKGKQYNLRIWKTAWNGNRRGDLRVIDTALLNLARRSFLRIQGGQHQKDRQSLEDSFTIRIHKQLRQMGKWISAPTNEAPSKWRGLWRVEDVGQMLLFSSNEEDKPQTEVLSFSMEHHCSYFENSNSQDAGSVVQWSSVARLEKLRLLKISNVRMTGGESDLRLPTRLTLLDMKNCARPLRTSPSEWMWKVIHSVRQIWNLDNHSWPICEEDVERLPSLSVVILDNCNIVQLPDNIDRLGRLKILRIDTGGMFMSPLPRNFGKLPALEHLELRAPLESLPNSLFQLSSLQSMVLDGLHIQALPNPITGNHLTTLTSLDLIDLPVLAELPDSFGGLASLQRLMVVNCSALKKLPEGFGNLHRLEWLKIESCEKLETLCDSFFALRRLRSLTLTGLRLMRTLPKRFGYLSFLEYFQLEWCRLLKELPEGFNELTSVRTVKIIGCEGLETLWSNLGHADVGFGLKNLDSLTILGCNELRSLPSSLGKLPSLTDLMVMDCWKLRDVPESVWHLTSLTTLKFGDYLRMAPNVDGSGRSLPPSSLHLSEQSDFTTSISGTFQALDGQNTSSECFSYDGCETAVSVLHPIAQLTALKVLRVSNYPKICWLVQSVCYLTSLTMLNLWSCADLVTIPEAIGELSSLREIDIWNCKNLVGLPKSIGQLSTLYYLHIGKCGLVKLPESIGQLPCLRELTINECVNLVNLPESMGQLQGLFFLRISSCGLMYLPKSMVDLRNLRVLTISNCKKLVTIPDSLFHIASLKELCILDSKHFVNMIEKSAELKRLRTLGLSIWNDMSLSLQSFQQICSTIRTLVIKCALCENLVESNFRCGRIHEGRRDRIDDSCGCEHVLPLLKCVENYFLEYSLQISEDYWNLFDFSPIPGEVFSVHIIYMERERAIRFLMRNETRNGYM